MRLGTALLLLALPLAVAVWAFGAVAAKRERSNADDRLVYVINRAAVQYAKGLKPAQQKANRIAHSRRVQRAFVHHDRTALRRLERSFGADDIRLLLPSEVGGASPLAAQGRADVAVPGKKVAGHVLVGVLNERLARRIAGKTDQPPDGVGFLIKRSLVTGAGSTAIPGWPALRKPRDLADDRVVGVRVRAQVRRAVIVAAKRSQ